MNPRERFSRRELVRLCGLGSLWWASSAERAGGQTEIPRTPGQVLGPFYPTIKPGDHDADMTLIAGRTSRAAGQVIELSGRVINRHCRPVSGARIEVWQANTHGRYAHPSDRNPAPLDPNFEGFALLTTDADGRYRLTSIKPAPYPEDSGALRAPHIHFDVLGRSNREPVGPTLLATAVTAQTRWRSPEQPEDLSATVVG